MPHIKNKIALFITVAFVCTIVGVIYLYKTPLLFLVNSNYLTSNDSSSTMVAATYTALTTYKSTTTAPVVVMTVATAKPGAVVPKTVYGEGLLNYYASDAFVRTPTFLKTVKDSQVGALRWPSAGHTNVPIFHFDNNHTNFWEQGSGTGIGKTGYTDPAKIGYTTKKPGNIWDPLYNPADAGVATEQVTLGGFVNAIKNTSTTPMMIFTWRSGELWRDIDGKRVPYRDPAPRTIDGKQMAPAVAAKLTARQLQQLENRLMLKEYYDAGGPKNLVAQIGEELWAGWEDGQIPWENSGLEKTEWISQTLKPYFTDLAAFATEKSYPVRFAVQIREASEGGDKMPIATSTRLYLRGGLDALLTNLGPNISFMTASVHYRGSWNEWLTQPQMQMAFMTDKGQGSLADIRKWFKAYVETKGYKKIEFIPHANSFGEIPQGSKAAPVTSWQIGLMSSQYLIEAIKAGYEFTFGFPGFLGDYDQFASLEKTNGIAGWSSNTNTYTKAPMLYALSSIGEALQHNAQLINVSNTDPAIVSLGLLYPHHLRLYFINKHNSTTTTAIDTGVALSSSTISVQRYSETETTLPKILPQSILNSYPSNPNKVYAKLAPFSMTVIDLSI